MRIAIIETNPANREKLRNICLRFSMQNEVELDVVWFVENITLPKLQRCISGVHMALISAQSDPSREFAKAIYRCNEDCRILYYSGQEIDLEPLLCIRARGFHLVSNGADVLMHKMQEVIEELTCSHRQFCFETRKSILLISLSDILYFQSDLKHVLIHMTDQTSETVYAKLSDVEADLPPDFYRVHKSYIVNKKFIKKLDKSNKTLILTNGEVLPISDAHYKNVVGKFR